MSSLGTACTSSKFLNGKRTLQRLRRQAGYRSAKEFAEALGVPPSTYARYERAGDGADCGIPLPAAWQIADKLGCSIDLVVGREDIDTLKLAGIDARYGALSLEGRVLVDSYLSYVEESEASRARLLGRG
ncbi:helix-turn-helix domain-containing protein [Collinsella intestinalis]|uniref:helix-turn-helix domain-containing protein n=1 Tax=Collinsella intestinalis TaxID=147207 RepID=UPI00195C6DAC|nr:helix-turn-helix transcriptional regulator [Collinsella intestinalis]MBM6942621.1 helix-turn-helix transcriptional regulator [Collinsella intestinalis]